jgi:ABC-type proline/glycine betaine transport system permease subunit
VTLEDQMVFDVAKFAEAVAAGIDQFTDYLSVHFSFFFDFIASVILGIEEPIAGLLGILPAWFVICIAVAVGFYAGRWRLSLLAGISLLIVLVFNLWAPAMETFALVLTATLLALVVGVPLGILMAEFRRIQALFEPILDFMQTMPPFVLLVPAVFFFGVGTVPGVVATVFFAMPLPIRLTMHGLHMVEPEVVEAGEAFGANRFQILAFVKLPLAFRSIMAGINQCIMMSLSMVIIASMIGAGGLGNEIIRAISRLQIGRGVETGFAVVLLAILIDRFTKGVSRRIDPSG